MKEIHKGGHAANTFDTPFTALDWGGPRREWFELICKTLFDTSNQLFTRFSDNNQGLVS